MRLKLDVSIQTKSSRDWSPERESRSFMNSAKLFFKISGVIRYFYDKGKLKKFMILYKAFWRMY